MVGLRERCRVSCGFTPTRPPGRRSSFLPTARRIVARQRQHACLQSDRHPQQQVGPDARRISRDGPCCSVAVPDRRTGRRRAGLQECELPRLQRMNLHPVTAASDRIERSSRRWRIGTLAPRDVRERGQKIELQPQQAQAVRRQEAGARNRQGERIESSVRRLPLDPPGPMDFCAGPFEQGELTLGIVSIDPTPASAGRVSCRNAAKPAPTS